MADRGIRVPALENAPKLDPICQEVAAAFNSLASKRTAGFGANPIQLSEIHAYVALFGPPAVGVQWLVDLIGMMDVEHLKIINGNSTNSSSRRSGSGRQHSGNSVNRSSGRRV